MSYFVLDVYNTSEDIGKKGNHLITLSKLFQNDTDIFVPDTIALTKTFFYKVLEQSQNVDLSDFNNFCFTEEDTNIILSTIKERFGEKKLVVRSSATCEDSIFFSASGQYDSFLNISGDKPIIESIKKVYSSYFNDNSKLYMKCYDIDLDKESMVVLFQPVAPVVKSGVAFSCDPVDGTKKYIIEYTHGLGTAVVEGRGNVNCIEVEENEVSAQDTIVVRLVNAVKRIRDTFGYEVDVEWGIDAEDNIHIFQTRAVIIKKAVLDVDYKDIEVIECMPISQGFCIANIAPINNKECDTFLYKDCDYFCDNLDLLLVSRGIITTDKNRLSHFSNIIREFIKPGVYIEDLAYKKNNLYVLDGYNGKIVDFESLSNKSKVDFLFTYFNYIGQRYKESFERYNGIVGIVQENKIEQVVFDIDEDKTISLLEANGFCKYEVAQQIYTYDINDDFLIKENTLFRIQASVEGVQLQLKQLDLSERAYRKERTVLIKFENLEYAQRFVKSFNAHETGYQERNITRYKLDDISINVTKWPGCAPYLGVEVSELSKLEDVKSKLELDGCYACGMGGKEIFERLNLSLEECSFKSN